MRRALEEWLRAERSRGVSPLRALLLDLPRRGLQEGQRALNGWIYRGGYARGLADSFRNARTRSGKDAYFVVAVPNVLPYLVPCLRLATRHVSVVLVLNGLLRWEETLLAEQFPSVPRIRVRNFAGFGTHAHGLALDLILSNTDGDVRLHDPDLYVFDPSVYDELQPGEREAAIGAFGVLNESTGTTFPTTHLLALRGAVLRSTMLRYGIDSEIRRTTPPRLAAALGELGLGDHNFPKSHLRYYDVLHLVLAMAMCDGWSLRSLDAGDDRVFHIGGVSYLTDNYHLDYLNHRFLALPTAAPFASRYRSMLRGQRYEDARARFRGPAAQEQLRRIDDALDHLTSELAG